MRFSIFVLLLSFLLWGCDNGETPPAKDEQGRLEFVLPNLSGEKVRLSDFRGKVVLINFWADWCAPCLKEIPELMTLRKKYNSSDLVILGIVSPAGKNEKKVLRISKNLDINYPVLWGDNEVIRLFGDFNLLPTSFVVTPEGKLGKKITGAKSVDFFEKSILKYLPKS